MSLIDEIRLRMCSTSKAIMKMIKQSSPLFIGLLVVLSLIVLLVSMLFVRGLSIYVTLIAIGLELALQKYIACFASYFMIRFGKLFTVGQRVRIGQVKGDVRHMGLFHFILDEVGEDEKLGSELTRRIIHMPNLIALDQPLPNYSQDYTTGNALIVCEYVFDEIRIPVKVDSNLRKAKDLLTGIIKRLDRDFVEEAKVAFRDNCPSFLNPKPSNLRWS